MRTTAIIVTQATGLPVGIPDAKSPRVGVNVSEWHNVEGEANFETTHLRNDPLGPRTYQVIPADARCALVTLRGTVVMVRESFQDVAALLGAAEGEPR